MGANLLKENRMTIFEKLQKKKKLIEFFKYEYLSSNKMQSRESLPCLQYGQVLVFNYTDYHVALCISK